jgi:hypothetical protein
MRHRIGTTFVVALLLCAGLRPAFAQERFGALAGTITDATQSALPGATVTATNAQTLAVRTAVTNTDGSYSIPELSPGRYKVTVALSGFQRAEADDLIVLLGRTLSFSVQLQIGAVSEAVQVTGDAAKSVDLRSVTVAHNVTAEELDRLPKARTFQGIALVAPSVNAGLVEGGIQVNGASGAENAYTIDGVVTTSLVNGQSRQNTVFEYLQEVQVKTGGIGAEYGGALGGVISAVTKSGGNIFRGEGHYYYSGDGFGSAPVDRLVLSPADDVSVGYFSDAKQKNNVNEFGGSVGGPIIRDRLFFYGSFSPQVTRRSNDYQFSSGAETGSIDQDATTTQAFGKLTFAGRKVQANVSTLYTPTRSTGTLPAYNDYGPNVISSSAAGNQANLGRGWESDQISTSGNVDFLLGASSLLSVRGGYFYDNFADTGIPTTTSVQWNTTSIGQSGVPGELQQATGFQNTPRALITDFDTTKRGFAQADYLRSFNGAGAHTLKAGAGYQRTINDVSSFYPGGYVILNWGRTFTSSVTGQTGSGTYGYYEVNDRGVQGVAGANIWSLFVQDTWTPTPRLTLNLGVRTENEVIPSFKTDIKENAFEFGFADKVAPRLGFTYDLRGDGRMKLFGSWGRYFDWTKYELSRGSFGADTWQVYYRGLDTTDVFNLSLDNMPGADLWGSASGFRDRRVPNFETVDPAIKPMYQDSTNLGFEYEFMRGTVFGVRYVHNDLKRTIEDLGALVNGDEVYYIANPGEGGAKLTPTTGATASFDTPKPKRTYDALELTLNRRFANNWFASGSYTYSRLYGNYPGLSSSDEIRTPTTNTSSATAQQQAGSVFRQGSNVNRAWDIDELMWDAHGNLDPQGRLATDRPHVVKLYGGYLFPTNTQIGLNFYGGSGTPVTTYVVTLNQTEVQVNGRGDMGRTPTLTQTDLLVSQDFDMGRGGNKIRVELNVLNVFNQKTARHIFNYLNRGAGLARADSAINLSNVDLAQGYDYNALINASPSGANAFDPRYGMADLFNPGTRGQVSVKFIF